MPIGWLLKAFSVQRMQARMDEIHTEMVFYSNSEGNETCSDIVKQHYLLVPMAQLICYSCAIVASFLAAIKQNPRQKHGMLLTFENQKKKSGQRWKIVDPGTHVRPPHIEQLWNVSGPVSCGTIR